VKQSVVSLAGFEKLAKLASETRFVVRTATR